MTNFVDAVTEYQSDRLLQQIIYVSMGDVDTFLESRLRGYDGTMQSYRKMQVCSSPVGFIEDEC